RSKNAGPFWLTIDIMFDDADAYRRARDAEIVNRAAIARLYNRNPAEIIVVNHDTALAIKVSFPRPQSSGSKHDSDAYAGPQYSPPLGLERTGLTDSSSILVLHASEDFRLVASIIRGRGKRRNVNITRWRPGRE